MFITATVDPVSEVLSAYICIQIFQNALDVRQLDVNIR